MSLLVTHCSRAAAPVAETARRRCLDAPTVRFYPFGGTQPVSCQPNVSFDDIRAPSDAFSALQAFADQVDLAAPVPRRLGLPHVDLGEMRLQRAPQLRETLALERFDDEIAPGLQPCACAKSSASSPRCTPRAWSAASTPDRLGDMSETTRSSLASAERLFERREPVVLAKVGLDERHAGDRLHRQQVDGDDASPRARAARAAPGSSSRARRPGRRPRIPGRSSWSRSASSISLNAARER